MRVKVTRHEAEQLLISRLLELSRAVEDMRLKTYFLANAAETFAFDVGIIVRHIERNGPESVRDWT